MPRQIMKLEARSNSAWSEWYEAPSESNPNKVHVVARKMTGEWGCDCPRWIYHREHCKHIRSVQEWLKNPTTNSDQVPVTSPEKIAKLLTRFSAIEV